MAYWRLSNFYLFYFASVGTLVPYWALYLKSQGFSAAEIGELMALLMLTKMIAPNLWGWVADHTGQRMMIVRLGSLAALLVFGVVFWVQGFWWMALGMAAYSFFWHAVLPQFEATTMSRLGDNPHRYSMIRLWGSVGFIIAVVIVGQLLDWFGASMVPLVMIGMLFGVWLASLAVPAEKDAPHHEASGSIIGVLRQPVVLMVLLVCFLLQASHGPYYTFYSIYLEEHAYSASLIGWLWALGVAAEIGVFLVMHRLLPHFGARALLMLALALTGLRWLLIAWGAQWLGVLLIAQLLHAASFGVYHSVAIHLVHRFFTGKHQGRGQALYSSLSFGAGGALGSLASGYLWEGLGASATYTIAAIVSLLAWVLVWKFVKLMD